MPGLNQWKGDHFLRSFLPLSWKFSAPFASSFFLPSLTAPFTHWNVLLAWNNERTGFLSTRLTSSINTHHARNYPPLTHGGFLLLVSECAAATVCRSAVAAWVTYAQPSALKVFKTFFSFQVFPSFSKLHEHSKFLPRHCSKTDCDFSFFVFCFLFLLEFLKPKSSVSEWRDL